MLRCLTIVLLGLALLTGEVRGDETMPEDVAKFLATRQLISTLYFDPGSTYLSESAKVELGRVAGNLKNFDYSSHVIRVEGFTSPEGGEEANVNLSMSRAMEVEKFLVQRAGLSGKLNLVGLGVDARSQLPWELQRRVEIASYENRFDFDTMPAERLRLK